MSDTPIMQCPYHPSVIPATCLTQEGLNPVLVLMGYYYCTGSTPYRLVKPITLTAQQLMEYQQAISEEE